MKKISFLLLIPNLFLFSCFSFIPITYGEGENELHGSLNMEIYGNVLIFLREVVINGDKI